MILLEPPRTRWDLKWPMFGVAVRVHPFFWLMALLLSYQEEQPFAVTLICMACILVSILVHEFGHALCGRFYGIRHNRVVLYHFGGLCISDDSTLRRWPLVFELLSGAGAGFVLGGLAFALQWATKQRHLPFNLFVYLALDYLVWINLVWGVTNLLPIYPLDGGQVLREAVLWKAPRRGDRFVFTVSFYVALLFTALGVALYAWQRGYGLYPAVFFGVLAYSSWQARRQVSEYGGFEEAEEPRQPWEQDPDLWKRL